MQPGETLTLMIHWTTVLGQPLLGRIPPRSPASSPLNLADHPFPLCRRMGPTLNARPTQGPVCVTNARYRGCITVCKRRMPPPTMPRTTTTTMTSHDCYTTTLRVGAPRILPPTPNETSNPHFDFPPPIARRLAWRLHTTHPALILSIRHCNQKVSTELSKFCPFCRTTYLFLINPSSNALSIHPSSCIHQSALVHLSLAGLLVCVLNLQIKASFYL